MILRRSSKDLEKILTSFVIDSGADHIEQQETITAGEFLLLLMLAGAAYDASDDAAVDGDVVLLLLFVVANDCLCCSY